MDISALEPRDEVAAARVAAVLVLVADLAMAVGQVVVYESGDAVATPVVVAVGVALLGLGAFLWSAGHRLPGVVWTVIAVAMVVVIAALDVVTDDAGGGAQVAFLYPVVYAGAFLRGRAAWLVAGVAVVADAVVVYTVLPSAVAVPDHSFFLIAVVTLTWVLVSSGRRQDSLVGRLNAVASVDPLTGLATRRVLEDAARAAMDGADDEGRRGGTVDGLGLILVDIDLFKELNDAYGHPAGDAVLVHTSEVLGTAVRPGDTVARLGGDELALLLPGIGAEPLRLRAEALRRAVRDTPLLWQDGPIDITVSIGVAHTDTAPGGLDALYAAADTALYRAKRNGRNRVAAADDGADEDAGALAYVSDRRRDRAVLGEPDRIS